VAELREHLQKRLEQDALRQSEENLETALLNAILETTEVDLPETLIEQETTQLLAQSLQALRQEGIKPGELRKFLSELPPETLNQLKERHRPEAIDRLRRTLALSAIVRQEQIAVGSTELDVEVEEVMAAYAQQGQKLDRERVRQAVYEGLLTDKVMAWLKSQTTVNWVDSEGNPTQAPTSLAGSEEKVEVPEAEFEADEPEAEVSGIPEAIESSSETATGAETDGEAAAAEAEPATEKAVEASPAENRPQPLRQRQRSQLRRKRQRPLQRSRQQKSPSRAKRTKKASECAGIFWLRAFPSKARGRSP
jgi:trigger factor